MIFRFQLFFWGFFSLAVDGRVSDSRGRLSGSGLNRQPSRRTKGATRYGKSLAKPTRGHLASLGRGRVRGSTRRCMDAREQSIHDLWLWLAILWWVKCMAMRVLARTSALLDHHLRRN